MKITKRQLRRILKEYEFPGSKPHPGRDEKRGYDTCPPGYEAYFDNTVSKTVCRPAQGSDATSQSAQAQSPGRKVEVEWDLGDTEFEDMPYEQGIMAAGLPAVVELPGDMDEDEASDWLSDEYGFTHNGWYFVNEGRKMKITKRQLKKLIREALSRDAQDLEPRLMAVWDQVSADTLQALGGQATWEDIADEVMASGYTIDPDLIESINLLPFDEQQKLFQKAFGAGRRY